MGPRPNIVRSPLCNLGTKPKKLEVEKGRFTGNAVYEKMLKPLNGHRLLILSLIVEVEIKAIINVVEF